MKRRSKLFLAVSGIVFGIGALLCLVGYIICAADNETLFAEKIGGDRGYTYYFKDGDLDILKLSVDDADINIIGGSDEEKIELLNFNENLYSFENTAAMVTFKQSQSLSTLSSVWDGGFVFKGFRYFLSPSGSGRGYINVYIGDEYIKQYDLSSVSGKITVSNISSDSAFQLKAGSGGISLSDISGASVVKITVSDGASPEIKLNKLSADSVEITASQAKLSATSLCAANCTVTQSKGSASIEYIPFYDDFTVEAYTVGKLSVNGESYIDSYRYPEPKSDDNGSKNKDKKKDKDDDADKKTSSISFNPSKAESDASLELTVLPAKENSENKK